MLLIDIVVYPMGIEVRTRLRGSSGFAHYYQYPGWTTSLLMALSVTNDPCLVTVRPPRHQDEIDWFDSHR